MVAPSPLWSSPTLLLSRDWLVSHRSLTFEMSSRSLIALKWVSISPPQGTKGSEDPGLGGGGNPVGLPMLCHSVGRASEQPSSMNETSVNMLTGPIRKKGKPDLPSHFTTPTHDSYYWCCHFTRASFTSGWQQPSCFKIKSLCAVIDAILVHWYALHCSVDETPLLFFPICIQAFWIGALWNYPFWLKEQRPRLGPFVLRTSLHVYFRCSVQRFSLKVCSSFITLWNVSVGIRILTVCLAYLWVTAVSLGGLYHFHYEEKQKWAGIKVFHGSWFIW